MHNNLNVAPSGEFPTSTSTGITGLDYAGKQPTTIVRVGNGDSTDGQQIAISMDSGNTWYVYCPRGTNIYEGFRLTCFFKEPRLRLLPQRRLRRQGRHLRHRRHRRRV